MNKLRNFLSNRRGPRVKSKIDLDMISPQVFGVWSPGPPTFSVAAEGQCQFSPEFKRVQLKNKLQISPDTYVFTFVTPDNSKPLNLSTCACILAKAKINGEDVVRPYTPCSTNDRVGEFDLMIKIYPDGKLTPYLEKMKFGEELQFKHIDFNVKIQYPFNKKFIGMIVGGTGITPMIQALHAILGNTDDNTTVVMLYGSRNKSNILGKSTLDQWEKASKQLTVHHVLSDEEENSDWDGLRGFITKDVIKLHFPAPTPDSLVFVCGPPPMYNFMCGPRDEKEVVTGALGELGYDKDQVYKF